MSAQLAAAYSGVFALVAIIGVVVLVLKLDKVREDLRATRHEVASAQAAARVADEQLSKHLRASQLVRHRLTLTREPGRGVTGARVLRLEVVIDERVILAAADERIVVDSVAAEAAYKVTQAIRTLDFALARQITEEGRPT